MIGVLARPGERPAVREFFELFKTPWEIYQPNRCYELVIATVEDVPKIDAPLLVVYSAVATSIDAEIGAVARTPRSNTTLTCDELSLPIYGSVLTFATGPSGIIRATAPDGEIAGRQFEAAGSRIVRIGYDLFEEIRHLLSNGQPAEYAHVPALDLHINLLRRWMVDAGVRFAEIPPAPAGHDFTVCLTHDIDFVGIRRHFFDHTMWGFLYRATIGATRRFLRRRLSFARLASSWRAALSLPFVYMGLAHDFWEPFRWYLTVENNLPATYFLIPFKGRVGHKVFALRANRRATAYDVTDISQSATMLIAKGSEVGVHGIDAWHDAGKGADELARVAGVTGTQHLGVRIHWLLSDARTASTLEQAGYRYDATSGYNDTVGYRNGTAQVFRPFTTSTLLELPLHIQDGALFYPQNLNLSDEAARTRCEVIINHARRSGGVLTLLWHDRSHAPERFWGDFYITLVRTLRSSSAWFATASQAVEWFRARRRVQFDRPADERDSHVTLRYEGQPIEPPLVVRRYEAARFEDVLWNGVGSVDLDPPLRIAS